MDMTLNRETNNRRHVKKHKQKVYSAVNKSEVQMF